MDPGGDPALADGQEREAEVAVGAVLLEQAAEEDPRRVAAGRRREESVVAPPALVEVDEGLEVRERVGRVGQPDLAARFRPPDLAPDLVAILLAERREVAVEVDAGRQVDDRADVLALDVERPALDDLAAAERDGEGVGGRIAAPEAAEVHDVPRLGMRVIGAAFAARCSTTASATAGRTSGAARTVA